nr:MAG TPA: hypothetical protein [Caudoviricetes sp.]
MTQKTDFEAIKAEILNRAKAAKACTEQYSRAYKSETLQELCSVIKDNFRWCFNNKVITSNLLMQYREDFAQNDIFINISVRSGFLLCDNATVKACGNATVKACGNATVEACDNATVKAWDNATVEACDNATVKAWDNATVKAWDNATVEAWGNATVEACGIATVEAWYNATVKACGNATVKAWDNATVEAWDNAYCTSHRIIECKLSNNAIYRVKSTNTVYYSSDNINFIKQ